MMIPKPGPRQESLASLSTILDEVFQLWVKKRDSYICICCGSRDEINAGHVFKRGRMALRWDEDNCFAQCSRCNQRHNDNPSIMFEKVKQRIGKERWDRIFSLANTISKHTRQDIVGMIQKYRALLKAL